MDLKDGLVNLHGRLQGMQDEFQSELASLIGELESVLHAAENLNTGAVSRDERVRRLEARAEGQANIIRTLSQEAEESHGLRDTVRDRDLEIARLTRELDTKNDLINALRIQLEAVRSAQASLEQGVAAKVKVEAQAS